MEIKDQTDCLNQLETIIAEFYNAKSIESK